VLVVGIVSVRVWDKLNTFEGVDEKVPLDVGELDTEAAIEGV
jgi:hypothetical protein